MATIIRGKDKNKRVTISQWCNDWMSVKNYSKIYRITQLKFTCDEFKKILTHNNNGIMLNMFEPDFKTRTFKRRRK
jgi:hypothetical protein